MKEIEIKSHLKDRRLVISKLEKLGCVLSAPLRQTDTIYTKVIGNVENYLSNDHFVRIRENSDGRCILTVKVDKSKDRGLIKTEHETDIKNTKEMESILFIMGYKVSNKIIKVRQTAKHNGYEICLDDVDGLGSFIELEKIKDNNSADDRAVLDELNSFMASLGVSSLDAMNKGYDVMMIEKNIA